MLPAASRLGTIGAALLTALLFLTPLSSLAWAPGVPGVAAAAALGVFVLSLVSAPIALVATVVLLPLSELTAALAAGTVGRPDLVDAIVIALAAGLSLRWIRPSIGSHTLLGAPAAIFAAALVSSAIVELHALQAIAPRRPLTAELWTHMAGGGYWTSPREFPVLHDALRWLAWLVAAVSIERSVAAASDTSRWLWRGWLLAGVVGASLTITRVVQIVLRSSDPIGSAIAEVLGAFRMTVLQPDVNAAGSYFLLFVVPVAAVALRRRPDWLALTTLPLTVFAFAMARSRAAIAAGLVVGAAAFVVPSLTALRWGRAARRMAIAGAVVGVGLAAVFAATTTTHTGADRALAVRAEMAEVALAAAARYPMFGVGLGDYIRSTRRFITPEQPMLQQFAPQGENAHNNFLQIAVELGIPAGLVFLWLVVPTVIVGFGRAGALAEPWVRSMAFGVGAFLLTALFGHPLLISQVGATFFVALGIAAGGLTAVRRGREPIDTHVPLYGYVTMAGVGFYALSLLWRL